MAIEYVLFSRPLNDETVNELVRNLNQISMQGQDIYLLLNCPGGNVPCRNTLLQYAASASNTLNYP